MLNATTMAFASSGSGTVRVSDDGVMIQTVVGATRSGKYSYVSIKARSVYPTEDYAEDTYTRCKTRLYHNKISNLCISDTYVLVEGSDYTNVTIYEGYQDQKAFDICFAGNKKGLAAYVAYTYVGN